MSRRNRKPIRIAAAAFFLIAALGGRDRARALYPMALPALPCCQYDQYEGVVWAGSDSLMTFAELAAYCAPILWFSPDEPLLRGASGLDIDVPAAFPFEGATDAPVVYFRARNVLETQDYEGKAVVADPDDRGDGVINLNGVVGVDLDYFFYYPSEEGLGRHQHDVESTDMKIQIRNRRDCPECPYTIVVSLVNCKAHGVQWYDNTLDVDQYTRFPFTVLVEEGKHASCTDKNGDGSFTPGYDVNRRVNDAWGVRDVIRGGGLFVGSFQSWFAKIRTPEYRVFPPLPMDSDLRDRFMEKGEYAPANAKYELRPFPHPDLAADDPSLVPFIADKGDPDWPATEVPGDFKVVGEWLGEESFLKSVTLSLRLDGDTGVSLVFPFLVVKNLPDPVGGGWIMNRVYFKDEKLRDFGWMFLYTSSASRWLDTYFAVGFERDKEDVGKRRFWTAESGFKFRADVRHSKMKFLSHITDFWGMRVGLMATGLLPVEEFRYVVEVGGGAF